MIRWEFKAILPSDVHAIDSVDTEDVVASPRLLLLAVVYFQNISTAENIFEQDFMAFCLWYQTIESNIYTHRKKPIKESSRDMRNRQYCKNIGLGLNKNEFMVFKWWINPKSKHHKIFCPTDVDSPSPEFSWVIWTKIC